MEHGRPERPRHARHRPERTQQLPVQIKCPEGNCPPSRFTKVRSLRSFLVHMAASHASPGGRFCSTSVGDAVHANSSLTSHWTHPAPAITPRTSHTSVQHATYTSQVPQATQDDADAGMSATAGSDSATGAPLHGPRDGKFTHALGLRPVTLIGSLRRQQHKNFRGLKVRIDGQPIAAI